MGGALRYVIVLMIAARAGACLAQPYPVKPVRYVVTGSPGSSTDVLGRFMADGLTQQLGRQFVVDNRTGAGSNIGPEFVSKSPADGYTLLQMTISHAVNATLYRSLGYDIIRDFSPVTQLVTDPAVLSILEKMIKQRKDSAKQFADVGRAERATQELAEAQILQGYLPEQLSPAELDALLTEVIAATGATSMKDMGKVMAELRARAQGRADMGALSGRVKSRLAGS